MDVIVDAMFGFSQVTVTGYLYASSLYVLAVGLAYWGLLGRSSGQVTSNVAPRYDDICLREILHEDQDSAAKPGFCKNGML